jgi:hypothetical protein
MRRSLVVALTTTDVLRCMVPIRWGGGVYRQTSRQSKRRSLVVAAAGPVLLHGDVLFNVTSRDPRPVIGDPVLSIQWQHFL